MKKILFLLTMCLPVLLVSAQKYDEIKNFLVFNKFKEAKVELDKKWGDPKFTSKAEAYMLRTAILAGLAMADGTKGTASGDALANEADQAFSKYKEMDQEMTLVTDPIYQNGPVNIYNSLAVSGYDDYSNKRWEASLAKIKKAIEYSDLLIEKKVFQVPLDTNRLVLAGVIAEASKKDDDAAKYYSRVADKKITGENFEGIYQFLVRYYFNLNDNDKFEKYRSIGHELYPKMEFFNYNKVDFAVGLKNTLPEKLQALEAILTIEPNNQYAYEMFGEVIYDALNPKDDSTALPANMAELENKMVAALQKSALLNTSSETPNVFIGSHFILKASKINDERIAHQNDMKNRTKPGTMASKEDIAKRDALDKKYGAEIEKAREPYEKVAAIFAAKPELNPKDKKQYKDVISYLSDIYGFKKAMAKGKPTDQAKFAAEEKKWNDLWESIK